MNQSSAKFLEFKRQARKFRGLSSLIQPHLFEPLPRCRNDSPLFNMHLMYTMDAAGKRIYTLNKVQAGEVTKSAHPARFSPDDK